jgi:hypothetical protein
VGGIAGLAAGALYYVATEAVQINGKSLTDWAKKGLGGVFDTIAGWFGS